MPARLELLLSNERAQKTYIVLLVITEIIISKASIIYGGVSASSNAKAFALTAIILSLLTYILLFHNHTSISFIVFQLILPILICDTALGWWEYPNIRFFTTRMMRAIVLIVVVMWCFEDAFHKISISSWKVGICSLTLTLILNAGFLGLERYYKKKDVMEVAASSISMNSRDPIAENIKEISMLDADGGWQELSYQGRIDLINDVISVANSEAGFNESMKFAVADIRHRTTYNLDTNTITINKSYLGFHLEDGYVFLEDILYMVCARIQNTGDASEYARTELLRYKVAIQDYLSTTTNS